MLLFVNTWQVGCSAHFKVALVRPDRTVMQTGEHLSELIGTTPSLVPPSATAYRGTPGSAEREEDSMTVVHLAVATRCDS
jgi:hypothetical protein